MTIVNVCVNGHEKEYLITEKRLFEGVKARTFERGKWKCPECLGAIKDMRWKE